MTIRTPFTMADFIQLVESNPDKHFDFNADGEIIEVSPKLIHGLIQAEIAGLLREWLRAHPLEDYRVVTEVVHDLNGWPCRPDVSINRVGSEQIPTTAPLLAAEIKSDSNSLKDLRIKSRRYPEKGTALAWLVIPEKRVVEVYQNGQDELLLTEEDTLTGGDVLPGFAVPVRDIFS